MKKLTILAVLAIAGAVASIVACGDSTKPADNPGSTTTTTSSGAPSGSAAPASS
jgi:hypothetical protein